MRKWLKTINTIRFEVQQGVARVTLNRPEKRNALNLVMLREIRDALLEADDLRAVHCVVLSGEGKDFCSGWDLVSATTPNDATVAQNPAADYRSEIETVDDDTWQLERMLELRMLVFDMHKPVIAQIHGNCLANGTDLAFYADIIIAANDAKIGYPPVRAQGSPAAHMWLYHLGPQWAKRMLLTGDLIDRKSVV